MARAICLFLITLILVLFPSGFSFASTNTHTSFQPSFHILPKNQQLIQNWVRAIVQDDKGFLWIGTLGGLHRFDGQKMVLVNELALDGHFLDVVRVNTLAKGSNGDIWVGGLYGSLDLIRMEDGVVEHYSDLIRGNGEIDMDEISKICPMPDGGALVGDGISIYRIDGANQNADKILIHWSDDCSEPQVLDFILLDNGKLLISNTWQVGLLDLETGQVVNLPLDGQALNEDFLLGGIERLKDGSIWAFGKNSALYQLVTCHGYSCFLAVSLPAEIEVDFQDLALAPGGTFWFALQGGGMATWNPISNKFQLVNLGRDQRSFRENSYLSSIFIDRSGVVWVGTSGYGLWFHDPSRDRFCYLQGKETSPFGFADPYIWQINEDSEGIVVMGHKELVRFDPVSGKTKLLLDTSSHPDMVELPDLSTFVPLSDGEWLLGFGNEMVGVFNVKNDSFRPLKPYMDLWGNPEPQPRCRRMLQDSEGQIWIFTPGRTLIYDSKTNNVSVPAAKLNQALADSEVRVMFESRDGSLWFGTERSGLVHYSPHRDSVEVWRNSSKPGELAYSGVRSIFENENGDIWIGTYNGLNVLREAERRRGGQYLELFTVQDGLPNNMIYSILPGADDELWFATNRGLCRFREESGTWKNFNRLDGLANNEFNGGAQLRSSDGYLLFGGIEGLTWFKPGEQKENLVAPLVSLTHVYNRSTTPLNNLSVPNLKHISLPWDSNRLELELVTLDFQQPSDHRVAYRIEGVDEQWQYAPAGQHIHLASLPSGSMTLYYRGMNNDGVWSEQRELTIDVGTPPWRTMQALLFYIFTIILLVVYVVVRGRRKRLQKEEIKQQMIIADKHRAAGLLAGGLAHDFGNLLQVLLAHSDLARRRVPTGHPAAKPLDKLVLAGEKAQNMVQRLLTFTRDDEPHLEVVDLDMVVLDMKAMLKSLVSKEISLKFDHGPDGKFIMGNIEQIEQILTNLCVNARDAINGPGNIVIRTRLTAKSGSQEWCQLSVMDDGTGISSQDLPRVFEPFFTTKDVGKGTGLGLSIVFNIVENHSGKVSVSSNPGQGTEFDMRFPRIKSFEAPPLKEMPSPH